MIEISMDDVGTRLDHITHLRDNWQGALDSLTKRHDSFKTVSERELIIKLQHAIELIEHHMTADFTPWTYGREINGLPPVKMIEGGRGTPLKNIRKEKD